MSSVAQPSFSFRTKNTPSYHGAGLTAREFKQAKPMLDRLKKDYAVVIYFKDAQVGHKSSYTMGELAHHLMVEGQASSGTAHMKGRPNEPAVIRDGKIIQQGTMMVDRAKNGLPIRNAEGKYMLVPSKIRKKVWNFVENAAKKHQNWRHIIKMMTYEIVKKSIKHRNVLRRHGGHNVKLTAQDHYYHQMQLLGQQIVKDCKCALVALQAPPLEKSTLAKKHCQMILIESHRLINALAYKIVKVDPKRPRFGGNIYYGKNERYSSGSNYFGSARNLAKNMNATVVDREGNEVFFKGDDSYSYGDGDFGGKRGDFGGNGGYSHDRDYQGWGGDE